MSRFSEFNNTELEILEEALCEYGCGFNMIKEVHAEMRNRREKLASMIDCAVALEVVKGINKGLRNENKK